MQMPSLFTDFQLSVPPLYRWNARLRRAVWVSAVVAVTAVYLLMGIGLVSGLALAVTAVVK